MLCSETGVELHELESFAPPLFPVELFDGISKPIFPAFGTLNKERLDCKPIKRRDQQKNGLNRLAFAR